MSMLIKLYSSSKTYISAMVLLIWDWQKIRLLNKKHNSYTEETQKHKGLVPSLLEPVGKFLLNISGLLGQAPDEDGGVDEAQLLP